MRLAIPTAALLVVCFFAPCRLASAQDEGLDEARSAFEAGEAAYRAGRFPQALEYFERAYELTEAPDLLYNIATVHDRLRHDREALDAYRRYLEARPDAEDRANLEARVRVLEEGLARQEQAPAETEVAEADARAEPVEPPAPRPVAEPPPAPSDPAPWVLVSVGAAVALGGGALLVVTAIDLSAVEGASGVPFRDVRDAYERIPILSTVGFVALGVGAALAAIGIGWGVTVSSGEEAHVSLTPGGLVAWGRF